MGIVQQANFHSQCILENKRTILCIRMEKDVLWFVWDGEYETC